MGVLVDAQLRISEHLGCGVCLLSVCILYTVYCILYTILIGLPKAPGLPPPQGLLISLLSCPSFQKMNTIRWYEICI